MAKLKVILSGGGTGGHIFPAVSIARKLKDINPDVEILFVGAKGKMEMEKVPKAGFEIIGLPVTGFHRRLTLKNLAFPFKLFNSMMKARTIIRNFNPDLVIGTGGFASGPILRVASGKGIPCMLQEQNAFPGVTNRVLAKKVNLICVAHQGLDKYFPSEKVLLTGNPVREDLIHFSSDREEAKEFFGISDDRPVVFVFGGSLGARTLNQTLEAEIGKLGSSGINLIWQTGTSFYPTAVKATDKEGSKNIKVHEFIYRMDLAYQLADVIISRAGAISISELCIVGKPVILVPYPYAAGDHQLKNARALEGNGSAIVIEDHLAKDSLVTVVLELLNDKKLLNELAVNIKKLARPDATGIIAKEALKLISKDNG